MVDIGATIEIPALPTSNKNCVFVSFTDTWDKNNIRFDDTYSALMTCHISKQDFSRIMNTINNDPDIKDWLKNT